MFKLHKTTDEQVHLFICSLTQTSKSGNHMAVTQCIHTPKHGEGSWLKFKRSIRTGKKVI